MALDSTLLEILRCPDTHHAVLEYDADGHTLTCTECRRVFEVRDGIPVLLLEEALLPGDEALGGDAPADAACGGSVPGSNSGEARNR